MSFYAALTSSTRRTLANGLSAPDGLMSIMIPTRPSISGAMGLLATRGELEFLCIGRSVYLDDMDSVGAKSWEAEWYTRWTL